MKVHMYAERRGSARTPAEGEHAYGMFCHEGHRWPVLIVDESSTGLSVIGVRVVGVDVGAQIVFESAVRNVEAKVASLANVRILSDDVCRIGLEWNC